MKKPSKQEKNIVGKALYELIVILNEIDLSLENEDRGNPDEILFI